MLSFSLVSCWKNHIYYDRNQDWFTPCFSFIDSCHFSCFHSKSRVLDELDELDGIMQTWMRIYLKFDTSTETILGLLLEQLTLRHPKLSRISLLLARSSQLIDYFRGLVTSCPKQGSFMLIRTNWRFWRSWHHFGCRSTLWRSQLLCLTQLLFIFVLLNSSN